MQGYFNPFCIPSFVVSFLLLFIAIFVYSKNKRSPINILLALECFTSFVWQFCYGMMYYFSNSEKVAIFWMKIGYVGVIFISLFYYHFIIEFLERKKERIVVYACYCIAAIFVYLHLTTNLFTNGVIKYYWGYYPRASVIHPIYLVFFIGLICLIIFHTFMSYLRREKLFADRRKEQIKYLFWAYFLYSPACVDYLANYNIPVYPFGYIFATTWLAIIAYAIVKHQLMGIEVIIKKTLVFTSLVTIVFGIFVSVTFLIQQLLMGGRLLGGAISCVIVILAYHPIENFLVNITDRYLFQKKYDYKHLIRQFMDELKTMVLNVNDIASSTLDFLNTTVHPVRSAIFLNNRFTNTYDIIAYNGFKDKNYKIDNDSPIIKRLNDSGLAININNDSQEQLKATGIEIVVPLFIHKELLGILALGKKKSDEEYTEEDIEALTDLSGALAITLNNAQLFGEKADDEKRALVGTLATGINHEISNPLNTITVKLEGLRIMAKMGLLAKKTKEEILDEVSNIAEVCNTCARRISEITMQIAEFAKPEKNIVLDKVNVCEAIDETITFLKHGMIIEGDKIEKRFSDESIYALADKGQLQQVIFNLLKNASHVIDKEKGKIIVSVGRNNDDKVAIKITDNGPGIPQKVLSRLFTPFFTTKEPGKGTGLGLALVKIMTERNNGIIRVESEEGKGTTFTLVFKGER